MTIIQRVAHSPALGKEPDYRKLLEGRVVSLRSRGFTATLMSRLLPDGGPELAVYHIFDNMDAYEKFRAVNAADADFITLSQEANALNRKGVTVGLFAPVVRADPGRRENARYFHRWTLRPSAGNAREVGAAMEEFIKARQADGRPAALTRQVLSPTGPTFILTDTYETLSEFESEYVTKSPPSLATAQQKIKGVLQSPPEQVMYEILL